MDIIEYKNNDVEAVERALKVLRHGGVVMHPTDTCYGLACDITSKEAVKKVCRIKKMPFDKPLSMLVDFFEMAEDYGVFSNIARRFVDIFWPGPLTLVVKRKPSLPVFINPGIETVAMRWPKHQLCVEMVRTLGHPIATTSANISTLKEVYEVADFLKQMEGQIPQPDLIIDGGKLPLNKPSTIVGVVDEDGYKILRQGDLVVD